MGGLSPVPLHVWRTNEERWFERQPDIAFKDGALTIILRPGSIYSLTTTTGQEKGAARGTAAAGFPLPYVEDFDAYPPGATPRFFSDQGGIFEVVRRADGKGNALRQVAPAKGIEWPLHRNPFPETFLGDTTWADYDVGVDALIEKIGFVSLFGRVGKISQDQNPPRGYWFKIDDRGRWRASNGQSGHCLRPDGVCGRLMACAAAKIRGKAHSGVCRSAAGGQRRKWRICRRDGWRRQRLARSPVRRPDHSGQRQVVLEAVGGTWFSRGATSHRKVAGRVGEMPSRSADGWHLQAG